MTADEALVRYNISPDVFCLYNECKSSGIIDDNDLEQLNLIVTLTGIGFSAEEVKHYLQLSASDDALQARLTMLEEKRSHALKDIHIREEKLAQLDVLRHQLRQKKSLPII